MGTPELALSQHVHALYADHHGWLYGWLQRRLGCPHRAADVAQDTFVRVLRARAPLSNVEQPRAWLTTTAKRLLIDEARHQRIEQAYLAELAASLQDTGVYPSPEQTLLVLEALKQLAAVLSGVSDNARAAFVRHYLDGETLATVAVELSVSTKMVQKYLMQVLLQCRRLDL